MAKSYKRNIHSLYIIKISKWFNMVMPVVVLFYNDNGLGMHDIFLLKAIYSVAIVAMEIPSGYLADSWGRKKTLLLGSILGALGFLTYSFSYHIIAFVFAEIILGIGHSFISGADSAMLYDSLKAGKKTDQYIKHEGRITSTGNFAEAIAGIIGGLLAAMSLRFPFYLQTIVAASAIPAALMLIEPKIHENRLTRSMKDILIVVKSTFIKNQNLRIAILFSSFTGTATLTFAWFVQPFLKEIDTPVAWFGIIWTLLNLTVGFSSIIAHKIETYFGRRNSIILILLLITFGYISSGLSIYFWGITFLFLFYLFRGIATPILKNYINQYTDSEVRATMLSVRNFIIRINFAVLGPLLGWITDHISLKYAMLLAGVIYFIASVIAVWPWIRKK